MLNSSGTAATSRLKRQRPPGRLRRTTSPVWATDGCSNASFVEPSVRQADVAFVLVDVDYFKDINDTLGHHVGDAVLRQLGQLFLGEVRAGQVVVRYGGDEFLLVLPGAALAAAHGFAERLRIAVLGHDWEALASGLRVTVSLGVACGPASDWQAVIAAADAPLYAAKQRGRNTVVTTSTGYPRHLLKVR